MKLIKLIIHNIASIEDAEIDFDAKPLSNAEVFLICGKTGAGKSTILDAITLALYNDTPRLENSRFDKGKYNQYGDEMSLKSPKQLMRRGAGECYVQLRFEGNDAMLYTAEWALRRARNRPDGNLQEPVRRLVKHAPEGDVTFVKREVDVEIARAVGLAFDEFCRTTLLAQGAFTQFLNSSDQDKAVILEKVTGVDVYSKIGKAIFDICNEKRVVLDDLKRELESDKPLQPEVKEALLAERQKIDADRSAKVDAKGAAQKVVQWFRDEADLIRQVQTSAANEAKAAETLESDSYKSALRCVESWTKYADLRIAYGQLKEKRRELGAVEESLQEKCRDYFKLKSYYLLLAGTLKKRRQEVDELRQKIDGKARLKDVYEQWPILAQRINDVIAARKEKYSIAQSTKKLQNDSAAVKAQIQSLEAEIKGIVATLDAETARVDALKQNELYVNLKENVALNGRLENRLSALDGVERLIVRLREATAENDNLKRETDKLKVDEEKAKALLAEMQTALKALEAAREMAENNYNATKSTIDNWAKSMRAMLHVGDVCPVCRRRIAEELPSEDHIMNDVVLPLKASLDAANENVRNKQKEIASAELSLGKLSHNIALNMRNIDLAGKQIEADGKLVKERCAELGVESLEDVAQQREATKAEQTALAEKIASAEVMKKDIEEGEKKITSLRNGCELKRGEKDNHNSKLAQIESMIARNDGAISSKDNLITDNSNMVGEAFAPLAEYADADLFTDQFVASVTADADAYRHDCERMKSTENSIPELIAQTDGILSSCEAIEKLMPQWQELFAPVTLVAADKALMQRCVDIVTDISDDGRKRQELMAAIASGQERLQSVFAEGAISEAELAELCSVSASRIEDMNKRIEAAKQAAETAAAMLEANKAKLEKHREAVPQLAAEDDTVQTAQARVADIEEEITALDRRRGAIDTELKQDDERRERLKSRLAEQEAAQADFNRWNDMCSLFGSADGKRFRNIAQSYILENLISNANQYLLTLMPRYQLHVLPGTFVIMVSDAYQGYVRRAVSNISGGESFMVSLALALALADVGQKLAVDTLFIDEGFGTLSGEPLQHALDTLRNLHTRGGRRVGIISHVEELAEKIPVKIVVEQPANSSASTLSVSC